LRFRLFGTFVENLDLIDGDVAAVTTGGVGLVFGDGLNDKLKIVQNS